MTLDYQFLVLIQCLGFGTVPAPGSRGVAAAGMRRAGTILRSPIESRQRDRDKHSDGDLRASEVSTDKPLQSRSSY